MGQLEVAVAAIEGVAQADLELVLHVGAAGGPVAMLPPSPAAASAAEPEGVAEQIAEVGQDVLDPYALEA